ncbi:PDZ and LIM domain protein 1 [Pseudolycoriella hygida]|uniref:PDZ and LIM domain protein 1 n=1 Tax=Pseudolycoriella hygida TaxID=35572 RepID=A0A9Q0MZ54_9DIPT|nr:PDZ and LIM domain protein 1 [Pseudolycoriella hygida]
MAPKLHEFAVVLERDGKQTPWGIRLVGGSDLDTPLIITKVQLGSPAHGQLMRGDILTKIGDYDARDLTHLDAQNLFKSAANRIPLVVHRDNKLNATHNISNGSSRCSSAVPPYSPTINLLSPNNSDHPHRGPSPLPTYGAYEAALESPVASLPRTEFPNLNESGGYITPSFFSPMPTRDYQQEAAEEAASIISQPYRTTPLILPGAKVKKDCTPTESYLRHHPNPAMRGPVHHADDALMKQRVQHKQFNSPIGLYSDSNIENTIRQTVPSSGSTPYKKTVVFDPSKSDTYRALQEEQYGYGERVQEIPIPVQTRVYQPGVNRLVPGKKPQASYPPPQPQQYHNVNSMGDSNDTIHQSHSFKRLMYSVMGETDY